MPDSPSDVKELSSRWVKAAYTAITPASLAVPVFLNCLLWTKKSVSSSMMAKPDLIRASALNSGMRTLHDAAVSKMKRGLTTIPEVIKMTIVE